MKSLILKICLLGLTSGLTFSTNAQESTSSSPAEVNTSTEINTSAESEGSLGEGKGEGKLGEAPLNKASLNEAEVNQESETESIYLALPGTVYAGSEMLVNWSGPGKDGDTINVSNGLNKKVLSKVSASSKDFKPAVIKTPTRAGDYQLTLTSDGKTLAQASFVVIANQAKINVLSPTVLMGEPVSIKWSGPRNTGDRLVIVQARSETAIAQSPASGSIDEVLLLTGPKSVGEFEVLLQNRDGVVLARQGFSVR